MKYIIISAFLILTAIVTAHGQNNFLERGNSYLKSGNFAKAEQTFKNGIQAEPNNLIYQCQLGLTLIEQKKYKDAEKILQKVLAADSDHVAAIWYSGIGNFKSGDAREAIKRFEKALTLFDRNRGQYYSANWFIGKSYSILLQTEGLTYQETDRMFECYESYLQLQPNAKDADEIREYVERKKERRPPDNVKKWIDL